MKEWQELMANSCHDIRRLQDLLDISDDELQALVRVQETYPMLVNPYYLSLIDPDDPADPIRALSIPSLAELDAAGAADTSGEKVNTKVPGLQHKYGETALLLASSACAMYCRHCFRRRFVGVHEEEVVRDIDQVARYIEEHDEIANVLVTGGDAFLNDNDTIKSYLEAFCSIDHVKSIRFGTRTPVVLPQRVTTDPELQDILEHYSKQKQLYVVTHFCHPKEVTPESTTAVSSLLHAGIPVRNQTVLLRGANDSPEVLADLMNALVGIGAIPYYVFQCRPAIGVKNRFQVPLHRACEIVDEAKKNLNGLAKCFRFIMSHYTGKIEILGEAPAELIESGACTSYTMLFKYHQARNRDDIGRMFTREIGESVCWLDD